jgi:hypothetical protein
MKCKTKLTKVDGLRHQRSEYFNVYDQHVIGKGHSKKDTWDGGVHRNGAGRRGGE